MCTEFRLLYEDIKLEAQDGKYWLGYPRFGGITTCAHDPEETFQSISLFVRQGLKSHMQVYYSSNVRYSRVILTGIHREFKTGLLLIQPPDGHIVFELYI